MLLFDTLDHGHLREFLRHRIRDGVLLRLIGKWLKAGVMENGSISYPDSGSPQGGVISPILANAFLHYVLDRWFAEEVVPRMKGRTFLIRYADDAVMGFTHEEDTRRVLTVLPKRFGKYGLTVHPEKTKLVEFRKPPHDDRPEGGPRGDRPGTFDLLVPQIAIVSPPKPRLPHLRGGLPSFPSRLWGALPFRR